MAPRKRSIRIEWGVWSITSLLGAIDCFFICSCVNPFARARHPRVKRDASFTSTGKERDSESGLDYFGARYYGSALGRFTSPDWSESPEPLPYADLSDSQTLNLYGYVRNNPLSKADIDGHDSLHTCTGAEQGAGKCQAGDVALQKGNGLGANIKTSVTAAATAVGNGIGKVSDFLNTAPGIGLVASMAIFAETGGQDENPAMAEAEQGEFAASMRD